MSFVLPKSVSDRPRYLLILFTVLSVSTMCLYGYEMIKPEAMVLRAEMSSSTSSIAQLFYDTGSGFSEANSQIVPVYPTASRTFETITFNLPKMTILHLRLDPSTLEGTYILRSVSIIVSGRVVLTIPEQDIRPYNQIASRDDHGGEGVLRDKSRGERSGNFVGPIETAGLSRPASARYAEVCIDRRFGRIVSSTIFALAFYRQIKTGSAHLQSFLQRIDARFGALGRNLSRHDFILIDSRAIWFYLFCTLVFLSSVFADLNGSSVGIYGRVYHLGPIQSPILGESRNVRSDEWVSETPAILNQVSREHPFQTGHSYLGDHDIALTASVPVRQFTTIFRPQLWAFFVLPADYAFAVYWNLKIFVVITGVFTLVLFLTGNSSWAAVSALWYFFSPFSQWTFSWPSGLPEMIGLSCFATVLACYLSIGRDITILLIAALVCAGCIVNLMLCAYLPHLIPILWLAAALVLSWCCAQRARVLQRQAAASRLVAIGVCILVTGLTGLMIYRDLATAIAIISATAYPGARVFPAGSLSLSTLGSHFFNWSENELRFPSSLSNICEASGFFWLAPATLFLRKRLVLSPLHRTVLFGTWTFFAVMLAWLLLPMPQQLGHLLALDETGYTRPLAALGLANIIIVSICVSNLVKVSSEDRYSWIGGAFRVLFVVFCLLLLTNEALASYFSWKEFLVAVTLTTLMITFLLEGRSALLAAALIVPEIFAFGAVNPVQQGLGSITGSDLHRFIGNHKELLRSKWIVYSDSFIYSGYLAAMGCDVYTGMKYLPDVDHFALLARSGLPVRAFNRDGYLLARPLPPGARSTVEKAVPVWAIVWNVSPSDSLLKALDVRYFAFLEQPSPAIAAALRPLAKGPVSGLWLYASK